MTESSMNVFLNLFDYFDQLCVLVFFHLIRPFDKCFVQLSVDSQGIPDFRYPLLYDMTAIILFQILLHRQALCLSALFLDTFLLSHWFNNHMLFLVQLYLSQL